jgi:hypothetical protein
MSDGQRRSLRTFSYPLDLLVFYSCVAALFGFAAVIALRFVGVPIETAMVWGPTLGGGITGALAFTRRVRLPAEYPSIIPLLALAGALAFSRYVRQSILR